ncbi:MAG: M23 family metallopeptidase [Planctomycetes bacterium]|nr:M23 family metallopeptidase [Planctomycetota bacterium]
MIEQTCSDQQGPVRLECYFPQKAEAPAGRWPVTVELEVGESYTYTMVDDQTRTLRLLSTDRVFSTSGGLWSNDVTVWATVTVEVSGPGLDAVTATLPVAFFQRPRIIHDLRILVEMSREFNDGNLRDGGETEKAARFFVSDGRYTMTHVSSYRYPIPTLLWQESARFYTHYQALQGSMDGGLYHHGGFDQGMPLGTPVHSWVGGTVDSVSGHGYGGTPLIYPADDGKPWADNLVLHLDRVDVSVGQRVEPGDPLGVSGMASWPHLHWPASFYAPALAEWYVAQNDPVKLSYVMHWLVAGPFDGGLDTDPLVGETAAAPRAGDTTSEGLTWKTWDNMVPGIVFVGESVDPYPNSGWAVVRGNHSDKGAYLCVYVDSDTTQDGVLRIGHSDPVKAWWNGQLVADNRESIPIPDFESSPTMIVDRFQIPVRLEQGLNRLLIKTVNQGELPWQIAARISDSAGNGLPGVRYTTTLP